MIRYQVLRPDIFIDVYSVILLSEKLGEQFVEVDQINGVAGPAQYRLTTLEDGRTVPVLEWLSNPLQINSHVRYDVRYDSYTVFDPNNTAPGIKLVPVPLPNGDHHVPR